MLKVKAYVNSNQPGNVAIISNPKHQYIEINNDGKRAWFRTFHSDEDPGSIRLSLQMRQYLRLTLEDYVMPIYHEKLIQTTHKAYITVKLITNDKPSYYEIINDTKDFVTKFATTPLFEGINFFFNGSKYKYLFYLTPGKNNYGVDYFFPSSVKIDYQQGPEYDSNKGYEYIPKSLHKEYLNNDEDDDESVHKEYQESIFHEGVNFSDLDIGGLDTQIKRILRTIFAGRIMGRESKEMGIDSPKGILMYGPPGNGKTLIARQLASVIKANFQLFNGPELISKYVGESSANARKIFEKAEKAHKNGSDELFLMAFDEGDSLFKRRSESENAGAQTANDVTNTLLSKIDGVDKLPNIIIIVMTNNIHMIDPAMMRPGRLEIHIEIPLPEKDGRLKIFNIHSKKIKDNEYLGDDVDFEKLAEMTPNFSGAEIKSVVTLATSYPLAKMIDPNTMKRISDEKPIIKMIDFTTAISEINPVMGCVNKELDMITSKPLILNNKHFKGVYLKIKESIQIYMESGINKCNGRNFTILLTGDNFTGKTKMIAHIVKDFIKIFSHVKFINPEKLMDESGRIWSKYKDGLYSNEFLFVIDSIETIFDYTSGGMIPQQTRELLSILGSNVEQDKKVVTIMTCSDLNMVRNLNLERKVTMCFNLSSIFDDTIEEL